MKTFFETFRVFYRTLRPLTSYGIVSLLVFFCQALHAQQDSVQIAADSCIAADKIWIGNIVLVDDHTGEPLALGTLEDPGMKVKVAIYEKDSVTLLTDQIYPSSSGKEKKIDHFSASTIPLRREVVFKVDIEGFRPAVQAVGLSVEGCDVLDGYQAYYYTRPIELRVTHPIYDRMLKEATVTASRLLMVMKGDTIEYNAAALQLSAGAMLSHLMRALPGVELSNDGRIYVNGEFVDKMLINGRDFFNGDPKVALYNLPSYAVDKVKVYRRRRSVYTDEADSLHAMNERAALEMDVRLKREYSRGWLVNFEAGGGVKTRGEHDGVYRGRAFAMRYTDRSSLGVYATANNVGDNYSPTHSGAWREMKSGGRGVSERQSAGLDYRTENKEARRSFHTTLDAFHNVNTVEEISSSVSLNPLGSDLFGRSRSGSRNRRYSLEWNAGFNWQSDVVSLSVMPKFSYSRVHGRSTRRYASFEGDPCDIGRAASLDSLFGPTPSQRLERMLISCSRSAGRDATTRLNAGVSVSGSVRITKRRTVNLSGSVEYSDDRNKEVSLSEVRTRQARYPENQAVFSPDEDFAYSFRASHTLLSVQSRKASVSFRLSYDYNHRKGDEERDIRRNADDYGFLLPGYGEGRGWTPDMRNSYATDTRDQGHRLKLDVSFLLDGFREGRYVNVDFCFPLRADNRFIADRRGGGEQRLRRRDLLFEPSLTVSALGGEFRAGYLVSHFLPRMSDLLDVVDDAYSLFRRVGNPGLHPSRRHSFDLSWQPRNRKSGLWRNLSLRHDICEREFAMTVERDLQTGVTTSQMRNLSGRWNSQASFNLGFPLDPARRLSFATQTGYELRHNVGFYSYTAGVEPGRQTMMNHCLNQNIRFSYNRNPFRASLSGGVKWTRAHSPSEALASQSFVDVSCGLALATSLLWGIDFDTDLLLTMRRGYDTPAMNEALWVWNASLSRALDRKGRWVARAVGFDLLQQLSDVRLWTGASGYSEQWTNSVHSYVSLSVTYYLDIKPRKKGIL